MEETLRALDEEVKALARKWSKDKPEEWEDLAQEARIAIYQEVQGKPNSPRSHLLRRAKEAILDYRKRGKSVDTKRDKGYKRPFVWQVVSLEAGTEREVAHSPVEEAAVAQVSCEQFRASLSGLEDRYLSLRMQGYTWKEAEALLGLTPYQGARLRRSLRQKAATILCPPETG